MNKFFFGAVTIAAILLVGCGKEKTPDEYVRAENFTIHTTEVYSETYMSGVQEETTATAPMTLSYSLNGTSVELYIDGVMCQVIPFYYTPDSTGIAVADFNFDGYSDIYIPYESPPDFGYYYCYDPEKKTFEENNALAEIGMMSVTGEGVLTRTTDDGYVKRSVDYQWNGSWLKPVKKTEVYENSEDNKIHTDVYVYDADGVEYLSESMTN
ncbi:MAG: hypothetical protein J6K77_07180 [Ruminococcus sp.]|nr:hypothetical protein [Ruminococcus sp.]